MIDTFIAASWSIANTPPAKSIGQFSSNPKHTDLKKKFFCVFLKWFYISPKDFCFIFALLNFFVPILLHLVTIFFNFGFVQKNFKSNKTSYNNDQYQTLCFTDFYTEIRSCVYEDQTSTTEK